jgi:hypothetical protein
LWEFEALGHIAPEPPSCTPLGRPGGNQQIFKLTQYRVFAEAAEEGPVREPTRSLHGILAKYGHAPSTDTHTTLWYLFSDPRLGRAASAFIDATVADGDNIGVSAISVAADPDAVLRYVPVDQHIAINMQPSLARAFPIFPTGSLPRQPLVWGTRPDSGRSNTVVKGPGDPVMPGRVRCGLPFRSLPQPGVSIDCMAFGNIGRALAGQAIESTKKNVLDALRAPETAKAAEKIQTDRPAAPAAGENIGAIILGQIQAMQRSLKDDQELVVLFEAGGETLRVLEIFVPSLHVLVLAGIDAEQNVTRVVIPAESAQLVCKIMKVAPDAKPIRVNVLSPRPKPEASPQT